MRLDVGSDEISLVDFLRFVEPYYSWDSDEEATFWYVGRESTLVRAASDALLMEAFIKNSAQKEVKLFMSVGKCEVN